MPDYAWQGYDKEGNPKLGERSGSNEDAVNIELTKEGIFVTKISLVIRKISWKEKFLDLLNGKKVFINELTVFARQMQILHQATVPMTTAIRQLASNTRSPRLARALNGVVLQLKKGHSLSTAMRNYPEEFSPMITSLVEIGESTGHLSEAFGHIFEYLDFESGNIKQVRTAFRYPIFIIISVIIAISVLNIFVVPTFSRFYLNMNIDLPWETRLLIASSRFFTDYLYYIIAVCVVLVIWMTTLLRSAHGKYQWNKLQLRLPLFGKLLRRTILIRFSQSLSIMLRSQLSITRALDLITGLIQNDYIAGQISEALDAIQRGTPFTQAIAKIHLFSSLEMQILSVGEKNGDLSPALDYISDFHKQEINYDIKRLTDTISPVLTGIIALLVLVISLGVYLPIWNMINLIHK